MGRRGERSRGRYERERGRGRKREEIERGEREERGGEGGKRGRGIGMSSDVVGCVYSTHRINTMITIVTLMVL